MKHYQVTAFVSMPDDFDFTDGVGTAWFGVVVKNDHGPYGRISEWTDEMHVEYLDSFPVDEEYNYVASH